MHDRENVSRLAHAVEYYCMHKLLSLIVHAAQPQQAESERN